MERISGETDRGDVRGCGERRPIGERREQRDRRAAEVDGTNDNSSWRDCAAVLAIVRQTEKTRIRPLQCSSREEDEMIREDRERLILEILLG